MKSWLMLAAVATVFAPNPGASAQRLAPRGSYLVFAGAAVGGYGGELAYLTTKDFFTREVVALADLHAAIDPGNGSNQVVFMIGGALRVFGFERTIGNVPYRGFDIDLGFRIGPGFTFSSRETHADKNRRFNLFVEPYARFSAGMGRRVVGMLETGTTRPNVRFGLWVGI